MDDQYPEHVLDAIAGKLGTAFTDRNAAVWLCAEAQEHRHRSVAAYRELRDRHNSLTIRYKELLELIESLARHANTEAQSPEQTQSG